MLIKEEEASSKRCCNPAYFFDRNVEGNGRGREICIGSRCMAWRQVTIYNRTKVDNATIESPERFGYCGLAGNPRAQEIL